MRHRSIYFWTHGRLKRNDPELASFVENGSLKSQLVKNYCDRWFKLFSFIILNQSDLRTRRPFF